MNYIIAENISKSFGERTLFKNIDFSLNSGDKIGLIAKNGAGKTSFIKILTKEDTSDTGSLIIQQGVRIGYLPQVPNLPEESTIIDAILLADNPINLALKEYNLIAEQYALNPSDSNGDKLHKLQEELDRLNGWDFEQNIKLILTKLGITDFNQIINTLSGGQRKRVALAKILVDSPEVMIMDEPTNHLDIDMIEWLESYLQKNIDALLLVTHDRYFLNRVTKSIVELENQVLSTYKGNYEYYIEKKEERNFMLGREIDKAKNTFRKELEWMRRQPKARGTKSKARIESFHEIEDKLNSVVKEGTITLDVKVKRQGGKILELKHINKSFYNKKIIHNFDYVFAKGEKIGIVGINGAGKSTFLNIITELIEPDSGKVNLGQTTKIGYFKQSDDSFDLDKRLIEIIKEDAEVIELSNGDKLSASQFLQMFGFSPENQYTPVGKLSGGERRRLQLVKVLLTNPNFLILDEPTNDLDLITLNVLEEFLLGFQGCVLLVTHDRYFMDKLVNHLFVFEGEAVIRDFYGNYSEYREEKLLEEKTEKSKSKNIAKDLEEPVKEVITPIIDANAPSKRKLSFKEQTELNNLEISLEELTSKKLKLENQLSSGDLTNHEEIVKVSNQLKELSATLESKELRWLELSE
jgi:ATP-binding cassette subfamily F protein uup